MSLISKVVKETTGDILILVSKTHLGGYMCGRCKTGQFGVYDCRNRNERHFLGRLLIVFFAGFVLGGAVVIYMF